MNKLIIFFVLIISFDLNSSSIDLEFDDAVKFTRKINFDNVMLTDTPETFRNRYLTVSRDNLLLNKQLDYDLAAILHRKILNTSQSDGRNDKELKNTINIYNFFTHINHKFVEVSNVLEFSANVNICNQITTNFSIWIDNLLNDIMYFYEIISRNNFTEIFIKASQEYFDDNKVEERCYDDITQATLQVQLFDLYKLFSKTERKWNFLSGFLITYYKICKNNDDFLETLFILESSSLERIQNYLNHLKPLMADSSSEIYACNPTTSVEKVNYVELKNYKRKVIVKESILQANEDCIRQCSKYFDLLPLSKEQLELRRPYCPGKLIDCKPAGNVVACQMPKGHSKLYDWVLDGTGNLFGNKHKRNECSRPIEYKNISYEDGNLCDNCICTCSDDLVSSPSQYVASLKKELADVSDNRVITGIRFTMIDHVLYPQIKTGKLLPYGLIDPTSDDWKPVNNVSIDEYKSLYYNGQEDYIHFGSNIFQADSMALNHAYVNENFVITGVRFLPIKIQQSQTYTIQMSVRGSVYDFRTGIVEDNHEWVTFHEHFSLNILPIISLSTFQTNRLDLNNKFDEDISNKKNLYCKFKPSSLAKDVGQSTIPFFDLQPIMNTPGVPLRGINIIHKFVHESVGGLYKFKISNIDLSKHINNNPGGFDWRDRLGLI